MTQRREPPLTLRDEVRPASEFDAPAPQFDPRGRPMGDADLAIVTGGLAQQLSGAARGVDLPATSRSAAISKARPNIASLSGRREDGRSAIF